MAIEQARGCGYRKVNGLYLVGGGALAHCDRLPFKLEICPVCGSGIKFSRGFTWLNWLKYAGNHVNDDGHGGTECLCSRFCPVCNPDQWVQPSGLLWIGDKFYTTEEYIKESIQMGISRRLPTPQGDIPRGPKGLKLGKTVILCAHIKACGEGIDPETGKTVPLPGIFFTFIPDRLEYLIWQSEATPGRIEELEKAGVTPVVIPDDDVDHNPDTPLGLNKSEKEEHNNTLFFNDLRSKLKR